MEPKQTIFDDPFSDLRLRCFPDNELVICNRAKLTKESLFFNKMLGSPLESGKSELVLTDVSFHAMKRIVDYVMNSSVILDEENVLELTAMSVYFIIPTLRTICVQHLISNACLDDYIMIHNFAQRNMVHELEVEMFSLVMNNAEALFAERSFMECTTAQMVEYIKSDNLMIGDEENCWNAVRNWFFVDPENRRSGFVHLIGLVRFPLMKPHTLDNIAKECQEDDYLAKIVTPLLENVNVMQCDGFREFELTHPKYHLRDQGFASGIIILNDPEKIHMSKTFGEVDRHFWWMREDQNSLIGLFDPITSRMSWFHELPKRTVPGCICISSEGDLFLATSWGGDTFGKIVKYTITTDKWEVFVETGAEKIVEMRLLNGYVYASQYIPRSNMARSQARYGLTRWRYKPLLDESLPPIAEDIPLPFALGHICVAHGYLFSFGCLIGGSMYQKRQVHCFNPHTEMWTRKQNSPNDLNLSHEGEICHPNGLLYFFSCEDWYRGRLGQNMHLRSYDPQTNCFRILKRFRWNPRKRPFYPRGLTLWKNKLVIGNTPGFGIREGFGVATPNSAPGECRHDEILSCTHCQKIMCKVFDPETDVWTKMPLAGNRFEGRVAFIMRKSALREDIGSVKTIQVGKIERKSITLEEMQLKVNNCEQAEIVSQWPE